MTEHLQLAIRIDPKNPDHHLWNNNGTWYVHYTVYPTRHSAERVRRSLHTRSLLEARTRRDLLFSRLAAGPGAAGEESR